MKKTLKTLVLIAVLTQILLLSIACSKNSVAGKYSRDFGSYAAPDWYIELKKDNTYQTDGIVPEIRSKGTYEVSESVITFKYKNMWDDSDVTVTGTISGGTLTIKGATYKK